MTSDMTATESVKTIGAINPQRLDPKAFRGFLDAKGFDVQAAAQLGKQGAFAPLFQELVLRNGVDGGHLNRLAVNAPRIGRPSAEPYAGTHEQNRRIDESLANGGAGKGPAKFGEGAATHFASKALVPKRLRSVPVAVVGYGAAGILATAALRSLGFRRVTAYEKAESLGIWRQDNVFGLSRNNPQRLQFFDHVLDPAPGSGHEVRNFLFSIAQQSPKSTTVARIEPGNLMHSLKFADGTEAEYPIVINAAGLGKPKPVSDPRRMVTETGAAHAGMRWQMRFEPYRLSGLKVILIGLGNSTAEMLRQIHGFIDGGIDVDYRILTHYPEEAIRNPGSYVSAGGRKYRVFRDISRPNLVDYQGDLANSRYDYFRALHGGKIISGVKRWEVAEQGILSAYGKGGGLLAKLPYDKIMTLIGYGQTEESMTALGCTYDGANKCAVFDYDGESAKAGGETNPHRRLNKGYFGFGSVLESPLNPNAIVIPGMLHRIGDLMFGVVMRAAEIRYSRSLR